MSATCQPEGPSTTSQGLELQNLNSGIVLETLNLHGTAINTMLKQMLALGRKLGVSPTSLPASSPAPQPMAGNPSIGARSIDNGCQSDADVAAAEARALQLEVFKLKWYHRINLGHGVVTPGCDFSEEQLKRMHLPESLEGMTFLDIGAWDGLYSFEAERRGAKRVLATDGYVWLNKTWGSKAGFNLARRVLKSKVDDMELDVMEASPEKIGMFDVVLFAGVLYHLRHPLLALERVFSVTKRLLILETHVDLSQVTRPVMAFYPKDELGRDESNWWGPNTSCVLSMLKSVGFQKLSIVSTVLPPDADTRSPEEVTCGRIVVHAER